MNAAFPDPNTTSSKLSGVSSSAPEAAPTRRMDKAMPMKMALMISVDNNVSDPLPDLADVENLIYASPHPSAAVIRRLTE